MLRPCNFGASYRGIYEQNGSGGPLKFNIDCVDLDTFKGVLRFDFKIFEFMDGIGIVLLIMGIYGIGEVLINFDAGKKQGKIVQTDLKGLFPTLQDWKDSVGPFLRALFLGFLLVCSPGAEPPFHLSLLTVSAKNLKTSREVRRLV